MSRRSRGFDPDSTSDDSWDEKEDQPFRSKHTQDAKPASSSTPWIIGGAVVVVLAVIAAVAIVMTREGGGGSSTQSSVNTAASQIRPSAETLVKPASSTTGVASGGEPDDDGERGTTSEGGKGEGKSESEIGNAASGGAATKSTSSNIPKATSSSTSSSSSSLPPLYGNDLNLDFSTISSASELESYLNENRLRISDYGEVNIGPIMHGFYGKNVDWVDGAMRLIVRGQTGKGEVSSGEVATRDAMLYGRVTTRMKASPIPGVCHGIFWYGGPTLEVDIELLTSYYTEGLGDPVRPGLQLTNHPTDDEPGDMENMVVPYGFDPTEDYHDYTIEWKAGETIFQVDDKEFGRMKVNVPKDPMDFIWNSWSSGQPLWSAGPPTEDSYMLISNIVANWTVVEKRPE